MVSIELKNMSDKAIDIEFCFSVIDGSGKQVTYNGTETPTSFGPVEDDNNHWGWLDYAKRSTLISYLVDGTLIIKVNMKLALLP
jgi:hypothetical protein